MIQFHQKVKTLWWCYSQIECFPKCICIEYLLTLKIWESKTECFLKTFCLSVKLVKFVVGMLYPAPAAGAAALTLVRYTEYTHLFNLHPCVEGDHYCEMKSINL